jgi:stalled ribosome rescue protein Dom34
MRYIKEFYMSLNHAVAWIDHHNAQVLQIDAEQVVGQKVKEHVHYTRQHGSSVRSEHEFFGEVCDSLAGIESVLVTGSHTAQADFRHYVEKHRPTVATQIKGWETVDHPTEAEIVKIGREFFAQRGEMVPTPRIG